MFRTRYQRSDQPRVTEGLQSTLLVFHALNAVGVSELAVGRTAMMAWRADVLQVFMLHDDGVVYDKPSRSHSEVFKMLSVVSAEN